MPALDIRPIMQQDIPEIVELQATVWQDHFLKERNQQVPMMRRTIQNMEYYLEKTSGGCLAAHHDGRIVGTIISHVWGGVGWFGPLEVDPRLQGKGIGKSLVTASVEFLRRSGCNTVGCETMAGSARNIAFYKKQGFIARNLSYVMFKHLGQVPPEALEHGSVRQYTPDDDGEFRELWNRIQPGLDYSSEVASVENKGLGQVLVADTPDGKAHAIVHTYEMFDESQNAIIKLLAAPEGREREAGELLDRCELAASIQGKTGMFIRAYDATPPDLNWFMGRGYALQGASIRFILDGPDESGRDIHVSCWSG